METTARAQLHREFDGLLIVTAAVLRRGRQLFAGHYSARRAIAGGKLHTIAGERADETADFDCAWRGNHPGTGRGPASQHLSYRP